MASTTTALMKQLIASYKETDPVRELDGSYSQDGSNGRVAVCSHRLPTVRDTRGVNE